MNAARPEDERALDVRMAGVEYRQVRLTAPFNVRVPLGDDWRLYLIKGGEVVFEADDAARTQCRLPAGSAVALSGVLQHRFRSVEAGGGLGDRRPRDAPWVEQPLSWPPPDGLTIVMGRIAKSRMAFLALFERIILLPADQHPDVAARIARALDWIGEERARPGPESELIIQRLAEVTAHEIGRFERSAGGSKDRSARQAASDQRILRAISAFYAAPQEKWSLERLADVAGMSRTAFAIRYRELIGTTPLKSLRQLRMQLAADHLSRPAAAVDVTAKKVGYGSDAAFIRAYAREFGDTPGRASKLKTR